MGWWDTLKTGLIAVAATLANAAIAFAAATIITVTSPIFWGLLILAAVIIITVVLVDYLCFPEDSKNGPAPEDFSSLAPAGEFDYHASIHMNNQHFCSGAFIGSYFILTVAQCMYTFVNNQIEKSKLKVYVALREVPAYFGGGYYAVDNITVHPNFSAQRLAYNIAVLKLREKVTEPSFAHPISLPSSRMNIEKTIVLVSGFINWDAPSVRADMTKSNMTVIEYNICHSHFTAKIATSKKFCVIPSYRWKPCQVDRGSPAVNTDGILIGLYVMKNPQGCAKDLPEIFVDVSKFIDFVKNQIK